MYALVIDGQIYATDARIPAGARDLETGAWVTPPDGEWSPDLAASVGWFPVTEEPRPADTATHTSERNEPALVDGVPTVQWVERAKTAEEQAADQAAANAQALTADAIADETKIEQAIEDLRILLGDATTVGSLRAWKQPITNGANLTGAQGKALADLVITQAQANRRIARQVLRLARLVTGDTSSADVGAE